MKKKVIVSVSALLFSMLILSATVVNGTMAAAKENGNLCQSNLGNYKCLPSGYRCVVQ